LHNALARPTGAVLAELHDERPITVRHYLSETSMAALLGTDIPVITGPTALPRGKKTA
jgi:hypothetical protein